MKTGTTFLLRRMLIQFLTTSLTQFAVNLSYENWENVFVEEDVS